jgi:putative ATPase
MLAAREDVRKLGALPVPMHIRNAPTPLMKELGYGEGYRYPHDYQGALTEQDYLPEELLSRRYYQPSERGYEVRIRQWVEAARQVRARSRQERPRDPDESQE